MHWHVDKLHRDLYMKDDDDDDDNLSLQRDFASNKHIIECRPVRTVVGKISYSFKPIATYFRRNYENSIPADTLKPVNPSPNSSQNSLICTTQCQTEKCHFYERKHQIT